MNDQDRTLNDEKWKIFGLDTFEACSRADTPGAGWYLINEFDYEDKALLEVEFIHKLEHPVPFTSSRRFEP